MFWWPVQGVTFATLPVVFACGFIKLLRLGRILGAIAMGPQPPRADKIPGIAIT